MGDRALISLLSANVAISNMVGGRIRDDVPGELEPRPLMFFTQISGEEIVSLTGRSGLVHPRYQLEIQAQTRSACRDIVNAVLALLNPYRGTAPDGTVIQVCRCVDRRSSVDDTGLNDGRRWFVTQLDFMVWYEGL